MGHGQIAGLTDRVAKTFRAGTHRAATPAETLERVGRLMPVLGITRLANVTGLDVIGIPVAMACRPNARSLSVSQGKGLDLGAAKASGLMEATELYHAERIAHPLLLASHAELRYTHDLADVGALPQLPTSPWHEQLRMLWIEAYDLLAECPRWVPYETVHINLTFEFLPGAGCFPVSSNGLASGNHVSEAITHGICEVIERDADAVWRARGMRGQAATRLDLGSVDDPACQQLIDQCLTAGADIAVWDQTSDLGVPAFRCTIADVRERRFSTEAVALGMGCHPSRAIALSRAITEAAQSRLTMIAGSRDDMFRDHYHLARNPDIADPAQHDQPIGISMRAFGEIPTKEHDSIREDLEWLLQRLVAVDVTSVLVVDLTQTALQVPVVRVVIPQLESSPEIPGYRPGARALAMAAGGTG